MNGEHRDLMASTDDAYEAKALGTRIASAHPNRTGRGPARLAPPDLVWRLISSLLLLALAVGALVMGNEAAAESRSLQVVGVQPLDASASRAGGPRQGAVNQSLYEAVSRVALDLVAEYGPPLQSESEAPSSDATDAAEENQIKSALGQDMTPFARSFRIVEDQGSRPVLFPGESKATREYVVVVDVTVDVDRVRTRLAERGLIAIEEDATPGGGVEIDALGLRHWSGFEAFVALLESPAVGASEVRPLEFEAGRARVFAVVQGAPEDVLARILAAAPPDLAISARGSSRGESDAQGAEDGSASRLDLVVLWTPPSGGGH